MSKREAAWLLGVSVRTIDYLRQRGELAWVVIGREVKFNRADVEALADTRGTAAL